MKLCPSIVTSAMSLAILVSSAPKLLLLSKLYLAINPRLRMFKLIKGLFLVEWVPSLLFLLLHRCNAIPKTTIFQWFLGGMLGQKLIMLLLIVGLLCTLDENPASSTRGRWWLYLSQCLLTTLLLLPLPLFAQVQFRTPL
jgi:hypothetical protein